MGVGRPSSGDWRPPKETEANTESSLEPLEGAWSYWKPEVLDFRVPAARTTREYISVI